MSPCWWKPAQRVVEQGQRAGGARQPRDVADVGDAVDRVGRTLEDDQPRGRRPSARARCRHHRGWTAWCGARRSAPACGGSACASAHRSRRSTARGRRTFSRPSNVCAMAPTPEAQTMASSRPCRLGQCAAPAAAWWGWLSANRRTPASRRAGWPVSRPRYRARTSRSGRWAPPSAQVSSGGTATCGGCTSRVFSFMRASLSPQACAGVRLRCCDGLVVLGKAQSEQAVLTGSR